MSTLEREIMEKFHQLQPAAKQRIRALIEQETAVESNPAAFDYEAWFHDMEALRQQVREGQQANLPPIDVVGLLRDIRDGEDE